MFLSADALGLLVNPRASRGFALARTRPHEEVAGDAARQLHGAVGALRFDDRLPMAGHCGGSLACLGAWIHGRAARFGVSGPLQDSACRGYRRSNHRHSSVAQPAARGTNSSGVAWAITSDRRAHLAAIRHRTASLFRAGDYRGPLRGIPVSWFCHGRSYASGITSRAGRVRLVSVVWAGAQLSRPRWNGHDVCRGRSVGAEPNRLQ